MKKLYLTICMLGLATNLWAGTYSGGNGTEFDPYLINDANDMNEIGATSADWGSYFEMANDINLAQFTGTQFNIIGNDSNAFTGVFDGNNHTIFNFTYSDNTGLNNIGIFGCVNDADAEIRNLTLTNANVPMGNSLAVGSLLGWLKSGTIRGCCVIGVNATGVYVSGNNWAGGLVGKNEDGAILECFVAGKCNIYAKFFAGGLVGLNEGMIADCYRHTIGQVFASYWYAGGLVGRNGGTILRSYSQGKTSAVWGDLGGLVGGNWGGAISTCYAAGQVEPYLHTVEDSANIGGLVGYNYEGIISDCYSTSSVLGNDRIGGLVGDNQNGVISYCYATGVVDGNENTGGLVGQSGGGAYDKCLWDSDVNPDVNGIGNITDSNVTAKSTVEMQTLSTFVSAGWDFGTPVWVYYTNGYPRLAWEPTLPIGDLNHDGRVDFFDFAIFTGHWLEAVE